MPSRPQPIAVVGFAFRFPQGIESLAALRRALEERFSGIDTVPLQRWSVERYYSSNAVSKGKSYIQRGGFLTQDISQFDAAFFGISPRDAENMDPQQRLLLEVVWEAFENAGLSLPAHAGRQVGVYVGGFMLDHMISQMAPSNRSQINQHTAAGMMMTMLSNRISHTFDLRGPSLSIDTACSSSLVAFHHACQDLWRGAAEVAIVGGANVMTRPEYPMGMCKGHFLSRDGECKSFDARGDGYGRGEGAAAVLLKPLDQAIADGDPILATVIATGTNQDGRTPGISMPSRSAQQTLIQQVCDQYDVDPRRVQYVECHGTGTAVGDPTESAAVGSIYGAARRDVGPVVVGSIKSNIGHTEAVAGVAGIIKTVVTLMDRRAYPLANLQTCHPDIPFEQLNLRISDAINPLDEECCAAVNSFGYGGSNAHVIMQAMPTANQVHTRSPEPADQPRQWPYFLPISARDPKALHQLAHSYAELLSDESLALDDVLYSASHRRAHLEHRAVIQGQDRAELISGLGALHAQQESPNVVTNTRPFQGNPAPVFVFTGMGPQWWAMGQQLYQHNATYRTTVDEADQCFKDLFGWSVLDEMLKDEASSRITDTQFAQPANLFIQLGLLAVLKSAGVQPAAVVGHSVGELGSAFAAGVLSLRDCIIVCYHRSQLQATCAGSGGMLAAAVGQERAQELIAAVADRVSIAAVNGPSNVTLAGDIDCLTEISAQLSSDGIFNRRLEVEVPYHSPMMDPIMEPLRSALEGIKPSEPTIPLYSTVTGQRVSGIAYGADYWPKNARQAVLFAPAIAQLLADGYTHFVEIGPHPVLATSLGDCIRAAGKECRTLFTLRRNQPEIQCVHRAIMSIHAAGSPIDWSQLHRHGRSVALPNYAWQRQHYWLENDRARQDRIAQVDYPILGIQEAPGAPHYRNDFDHEPMMYLRDHVVTGMPVLPAAAYIEGLLELAGAHLPEAAAWAIRDLQILSPLIMNADKGTDFVTDYDPLTGKAAIRSLENGRLGFGQLHVHCLLGQSPGLPADRSQPQVNINHWRSRFGLPEAEAVSAMNGCGATASSLACERLYQSLADIGLTYGPAFQTVRDIHVDIAQGQVLSHIVIKDDLVKDLGKYRLHPTLLDACFHSLITMLGDTDATYLPTGLEELCLYTTTSPTAIYCLGERIYQDSRHIDCNLTLVDESGNLVAMIRGMRSTMAARRERTDKHGDRVRQQVLTYDWLYGGTLAEPRRLGHWLVIGGAESDAGANSLTDLPQRLTERLEDYGVEVSGCVRTGQLFEQAGRDFTIRAGHRDDMQQVLETCGPLDGVVFLHGLHSTIRSADPTAEEAIVHLTHFTQAIAQRFGQRPPRAFVVTRCGLCVKDLDRQHEPGQAALNGWVRVALNELDGFKFTTIDLPTDVDEEIVDMLALELLADDEHDEVALRGSLRYVSELAESMLLKEDRVEQRAITDQQCVQVRAVLPNIESVGSARLIAVVPPMLGDDDIHLRIESMTIPRDLLLDPSADTISQPMVEIVACVIEVGAAVADLRIGMRVCGLAPADLCSHMCGPRDRFILIEVGEAAAAPQLAANLALVTRAIVAIKLAQPTAGETALVELSPLGSIVADLLTQRGVKVCGLLPATPTLAASNTTSNCLHDSVYGPTAPELQRALTKHTAGNGFDLLAVDVAQWHQRSGYWMLAKGGHIVDTGATTTNLATPPQAGLVIRTDLIALAHRPQQLRAALAEATSYISTMSAPPPARLDVSIIDLALRKLPLRNDALTMTLTFDSKARTLPTVVPCSMQINGEGTYLITGGLGGFGLKTAAWLIDKGAKHLVLTSRRGLDSAERQAAVAQLEAKGACVRVIACDGADRDAVGQLLQTIQAEMPPLVGIYHSAAVILDQLITEMDEATFRTVMRNKATAAWHLHELTRQLPIEQFVLYSSVANLVGNARQAAYSAANGFLNGLAQHRQRLGLPATSVNWGVIGDVGVVAQDEKLEQYLRYTGMRGIASQDALDVLEQALARDITQFGLTLISSWADWARFETRGSKSPRFATLIAADTGGASASVRDALIAELTTLGATEQVEVLAALMQEILASVLKSDPTSISIDRKIEQLGVDSLMATEIQMLLNNKLGLSVSVLELIGDATIRSLSTQSVKSLLDNAVAPEAKLADAAR